MGELADILSSSLRELAQSDARRLRKVDAALKASRSVSKPQLSNDLVKATKALLNQGSFGDQTNKFLIDLCRKKGIKRYSGLNKKGLIALLEENGIQPPPPKPYNKRTRKELIVLIDQLTKLIGI